MADAWRIVKARHASTAFSGEGARLYGGRWTSKGRRAVYVSSTASLATLEIVVHVESPALLSSYSLIPVGIPGRLIHRLDPTLLPAGWESFPAPASLQRLGDAWLDNRRSPALAIPSAIVPSELNYLLNPEHADFSKLTIGKSQPYKLDPRLTP